MIFLIFRSLGRSVDENPNPDPDLDGILGDIMSKIEAKIRNYEDMIKVPVI